MNHAVIGYDWTGQARGGVLAGWPASMETDLLQYGYLFILVGTVVEGDATLLTAAFLAHRGYFRLSLVLLAAALSTLLASHVYYEIARRSRARWLDSRRDARLEKVIAWSRTHGALLLVASRFLIGFRTLVPIICGATGMSSARFLLWNSVGAAVWAGTFGLIGYLGGHAAASLIADIRRHEKAIAIGVAAVVGGTVLWRTHGQELVDAWSLRRARGLRSR